jgi:hypothetical protein
MTTIDREALLRDLTTMLGSFEKSNTSGEINIFIRNGKPVALWNAMRPPIHFYVAGLSDDDYKNMRPSIAREQHATLEELDAARKEIISIEKFIVFVQSMMNTRDAAAKRIDDFLAEGGAL